MTLQSSGNPISLQDIGDEANGTTNSTNTVSLDDASIRGLLSKTAGATNSFNEYYGVSSEVVLSSSALVNGQSNRLQMTASSFISSGGTLRIPSNMWVWSDNVSTAALTIDIPCTIINDGYIIGKGGKGGNGQGTSGNTAQNGEAGGNAIKINSGISNVTITNNSGAYIAGGGGGGGAVQNGGDDAGGGGGAGGGNGGYSNNNHQTNFGAGGQLNAEGADATGHGSSDSGGEGGGRGGYAFTNTSDSSYRSGGGGGGRILPASTQADATSGNVGLFAVGKGGGGGVAGGNGGTAGNTSRGGGGGGWGAAGGNGNSGGGTGGAAGKAIEDSGNTYTLTNNGTIFGATT